jgi:hypothetical protein
VASASGLVGVTLTGVPLYAPKDNAGRDALAPAYSVHGAGQLQCGSTSSRLAEARGVASVASCAQTCKGSSSAGAAGSGGGDANACSYFTYWATAQICATFADCGPLVGGGVDAQTYKLDVNEGDQNDQCAGHTSAGGVYHYRSLPGDTRAQAHYSSQVGGIDYCAGLADQLKDEEGGHKHSPLIGFALDGIPIFGPLSVAGRPPADLDDCNGHVDTDHPYYHYHATTSYPYLVGCFRGCVCDAVDYTDPANTCPNPAFAAAACTPAAYGYDYSGLVGVAAATTALFAQTSTTTTTAPAEAEAAVGAGGGASIVTSGYTQVQKSELGLAAGATPAGVRSGVGQGRAGAGGIRDHGRQQRGQQPHRVLGARAIVRQGDHHARWVQDGAGARFCHGRQGVGRVR